jgi:hypothetical protein
MWKSPPIIKVYEALGAVADKRIEVTGNTAKCFSSSGNKHYDVMYDPEQNAIMTNDNGTYWQGYVGYPAIAFLLSIGMLPYREELGSLLKGIAWKDVNQNFNNDFDKALESILEKIERREELEAYAQSLLSQLDALKLEQLGKRVKPPSGY